MNDYDPSSVESKWQRRWEEAQAYKADLRAAKNPYYSLVMFPYPSGDKLHVGHWYNYAPADTWSRYMRMKGRDVFAPMGFDAFGLPAENHAIKTGVHPAASTASNVQTMIAQLKRIGCMYDWDKAVSTSEPSYYRWTQWLFLQMYSHGLAYKKEANVNFCGSCQTVLAREQCQDGTCERCGTEVVQKPLFQWFWKITAYTQKLLENLDDLDWPEKTKIMQKHWIGRKYGIDIAYDVDGTQRGVIPPPNEFGGGGAMDHGNRRLKPAATPGPMHAPGATGWNLTAGYPTNAMPGADGQPPGAGWNADLTAGYPTNAMPGADGQPGATGSRRFQPADEDEGSRRFQPPGGARGGARDGGRIYSPARIVHLVFSPHCRESAFNSVKDASAILRILDSVAARHGIVIHEAAAMPDHVHVLASFERNRDLSEDIVKKLKGASAREFLKSRGGGTLWGKGTHHENVDTEEQFRATLRYMQENPAKAGLTPDGRILSLLPLTITCFTTRPDTNFGATFIVLAPEHPFVGAIVSGAFPSGEREAVAAYVGATSRKTELERQTEGRKKTGAFTGYCAVNNLNGKKLPVWTSDFVLSGFGTGAVVGVPGHDKRDFEFAKQFNIPVVRVVVSPDGDESPITLIEQVQEEEGTMVSSEFLDGLPILEAKEKIMDYLEASGWGSRVTTYRLRDWLVSRQRYWGAPIPIVYDPDGNPHPIPEEHLPWLLPTDVGFKPTGESPLRHSREFIERTEKIFGSGWTPEFDTMDTFVCSSFYYLLYLMNGDMEHFVSKELEEKWLPVSMYIGGPEHACMHLIYARFVMMALKDFGFVSHEEPFKKLVHQGLITNKGAKMSKSKGNVVSPDDFVSRHGSDVFRMYLMFMGPFTDGGDWSDTGIKGIDRFVQRVWRTFGQGAEEAQGAEDAKEVIIALHRAIKKVTESMEKMHFNTAMAALMEFLNDIEGKSFSVETAKSFARLLAPLAPHLAEELWETLGGKGFVIAQSWPAFDPRLLVSDTMTIAVQVNGKVRGQVEVASDASEKDIVAAAKAEPNVRRFLAEKPVKKELYVKGKLVSIVV